ncbi:hypothetical protein V8E55_005907 [Tylopilus felleus]
MVLSHIILYRLLGFFLFLLARYHEVKRTNAEARPPREVETPTRPAVLMEVVGAEVGGLEIMVVVRVVNVDGPVVVTGAEAPNGVNIAGMLEGEVAGVDGLVEEDGPTEVVAREMGVDEPPGSFLYYRSWWIKPMSVNQTSNDGCTLKEKDEVVGTPTDCND